jgi:hypothetical protein
VEPGARTKVRVLEEAEQETGFCTYVVSDGKARKLEQVELARRRVDSRTLDEKTL